MGKITEWFKSRRVRRAQKYEEAKKEFEKAMGKPSIQVKVEIPEGYEDMRQQFLSLQSDEKFIRDVEKLVEKRLKREREYLKKEERE